ncbi:PilT protein domain protein [Thalassoporum mexicanum PCC 7367]|uniref:type II toxin-antitoxin system VapC family toxin n=1 Tax=Thalassoporum mexicanum TaxID=3457544 RepID=UPI00029FBC3A|nr:type II toxin-antitoxin system VapC family toxin [Pseudanabaena sp. PCC 7367]AFY70049.1 PilT protein domain protein [Pseudanabaena sp. PCC 7367]
MSQQIHYCDACVILGFFNSESEPHNADECKILIRAAEEGQIRLVTSAFSESEVVNIKDPSDPKSFVEGDIAERVIKEFFTMPWLEIAAYERETGEISRYLCRKYKTKPADATHVATAIQRKVDFFDTVDNTLLDSYPEKVSFPPRYPKEIILQRPFVEGYDRSILDLID